MQKLDDFFRAGANAFSCGLLDELARRFILPAKAHIGDMCLSLRSHGEVVAVLRDYRENLTLEGYDHSECNVLHKIECGDGNAQVFVEWISRRADKTALTHVQTSYILERDDTGRWWIQTIECLADPNSRFWRTALAA